MYPKNGQTPKSKNKYVNTSCFSFQTKNSMKKMTVYQKAHVLDTYSRLILYPCVSCTSPPPSSLLCEKSTAVTGMHLLSCINEYALIQLIQSEPGITKKSNEATETGSYLHLWKQHNGDTKWMVGLRETQEKTPHT